MGIFKEFETCRELDSRDLPYILKDDLHPLMLPHRRASIRSLTLMYFCRVNQHEVNMLADCGRGNRQTK